jgi:hypothetical protein
MNMEQLVERELAGEIEVLKKMGPSATSSATKPTRLDMG